MLLFELKTFIIEQCVEEHAYESHFWKSAEKFDHSTEVSNKGALENWIIWWIKIFLLISGRLFHKRYVYSFQQNSSHDDWEKKDPN